MIQFRRGRTSTWQSEETPLADGQPGYDKDRKKIKIGDGKSSWSELPDASGLRLDEILESEANAKRKAEAKALLNPLGTFVAKILKLEDRPVITYGSSVPDESTIGQLYLQCYDDTPEVDFVIDSGVNKGWNYRKWKSGLAECWCSMTFETDVKNIFDGVKFYYSNQVFNQTNYPITFTGIPSETATVQSSGGFAWLASCKLNTTTLSGAYRVVSSDSLDNASYRISIQVKGSWN